MQNDKFLSEEYFALYTITTTNNNNNEKNKKNDLIRKYY